MTSKSETRPVTIGTYTVVRLLGEGGMGRVFACVDPALDREVAIKVLRPDVAADAQMSERFVREARSMAKVTSPNVVTVHQVGEDEDVGPFLVMELVSGSDLSKEIRKGQMSIESATDVVRQAALGLSAAAEAGLVHRDIKPENLFRAGPQIKVADFGLARPVDGSASLTQEGIIVGTPHYMAPEIGRGNAASFASDMYALGATFFELLTGRPPFPEGSAVEVLAAHMMEPVPSVRSLRPDVSPQVASVVDKMLAKAAEERFPSYDALLDALQGRPTEAMATVDVVQASSVQQAGMAGAKGQSASGATPATWKWAAGIGMAFLLLAGFVVAVAIAMTTGGGNEGGDSTPVAVKKAEVDPRIAHLQTEVTSEKWDKRHAALKELKALGKVDAALEEKVGLMDLKLGNTCKSRRFGLLRLGRVGQTKEAIAAVRDAQRDVFNNGCMALDMWAVESKIRKRKASQGER